MKVGDRVQWVSQSQGHRKEKLGVIVEIVPAGMPIEGIKHAEKFRHDLGTRKNYRSYIVKVTGPRGGTKYYWPLVKNLVQIK